MPGQRHELLTWPDEKPNGTQNGERMGPLRRRGCNRTVPRLVAAPPIHYLEPVQPQEAGNQKTNCQYGNAEIVAQRNRNC